MNTIPKAGPGQVLVQCVWASSRGPKEDCRSDTGIVWSGRGDVKAYPADRWPMLAAHPDVWRLYDPATALPLEAAAAHQATQLEIDQAATLDQAMNRIRELEAMLQRERATRAPAAVPAAAVETPLDANADATDPEFDDRLEQSASKNTDLVAVLVEDDADAPAGAVGEGEGAAQTVVAHAALRDDRVMLTIDDLKAMAVEEVRQLASAREYMLSPRLRADKLYEHFLTMQELRAKSGAQA